MGLTNKQFDTILQHYDEIRNNNRMLLSEREQEIREKLPLYFDLQNNLNALRIRRTKAGLQKDDHTVAQCLAEEDALKKERDALLTEHGYSPDYLKMSYHCPICMDTGFLPDTRKKCRCFIEAQTKLLFEQSGIYDLITAQNFDTLSFDYFSQEEAVSYQRSVAIAKNFVTNFNSDYQNLLFCGNVGTGKTFLSCCIAKELMEQGISVTYCSAEHLFRMLVDLRFQEDKDEYFSFMEEIYDRDLLIIDDLGAETITDRVKSDLFTCINNRDIAHKPTIISTNFGLNELEARYDQRIFSRISGQYTFCFFGGDDIRIKKKLPVNNKQQ